MKINWNNIPEPSVYKRTMDKVHPGITYRWDVINYFISERYFSDYLEIGLRKGQNFSKIICSRKESVDPLPTNLATPDWVMTSDKFFSRIKGTNKSWDVIFIDGLHEKTQVKRDVLNSLHYLREGGMIFVHDVNVADKAMTMPDASGNVWEAWVDLRHELNYLMYALPFDFLGVIDTNYRTDNLLIDKKNIKFEQMNSNRKEILNLIGKQDFEGIYGK